MKRITVCVITYNQEKLIRRALDSVLQQKEWGLYRIIVSDDCSKDHTWDVLLEYKANYPEIVCLFRNEHNLGIYGNMAVLRTLLPESDLYCNLSGDDAYCNGYFEGIQNLIESSKIDTKEAVGIYSDWKSVTPDGREEIHKQDIVQSGYRLWSLKARYKIGGRSLMVTKVVRDKYEPILTGCGLNLRESHNDSQPHLYIEKAYYLPQVTSIYYSDIGISAQLSQDKSDYFTNQSIEKWEYGLKYYVKDKRDFHYATFQVLKAKFLMKPSWKLFLKMIYNNEKGQLPICKDSLRTRLFYYKYWAKMILKHD